MSKKRADRVSRMIREVVSEALAFKLRNPEFKKVTVHRVTVTDNLKYARIFVSISGSEDEQKSAFAALTKAKGAFKREIGAVAQMKFMPEIEFKHDKSLDYVDHISELLRNLNRE